MKQLKKIGQYKIPDHITIKHEATGHYIINSAKTGKPIAETARNDKGLWVTLEFGSADIPPAINPDVEIQLMAKHGDVNKTAWRQIKMYFDKGDSLVIDEDHTLSDFYYRGLVEFGYMISRQIPERFKKKNKTKNEKNSAIHGIKAFKQCVKILKGDIEYKKLEPHIQKFKHLHEWYLDSIVGFMQASMDGEFEKFKGEDPLTSAVEALEKAQLTLQEQLS